MGIKTNASGAKAGDFKMHPVNSVPAGWLECNGAAISRNAYAALFLAIGTNYGVGDGVNTFNLPDLRGEFVRGFDNGRGVDAGRVFGSFQIDMFKAHTHTAKEQSSPLWSASGGSSARAADGETSATGGTETRPRNVAFLPCIKY